MFKLIRLEWKKNNVGKYIRNAVIMAALDLSVYFLLSVIWELPMTLKRVFLMRRRETVRFLHQLSCLQAWLF